MNPERMSGMAIDEMHRRARLASQIRECERAGRGDAFGAVLDGNQLTIADYEDER